VTHAAWGLSFGDFYHPPPRVGYRWDQHHIAAESSVARGHAVAALLLDVSEKVENQCVVDLLETDL